MQNRRAVANVKLHRMTAWLEHLGPLGRGRGGGFVDEVIRTYEQIPGISVHKPIHAEYYKRNILAAPEAAVSLEPLSMSKKTGTEQHFL